MAEKTTDAPARYINLLVDAALLDDIEDFRFTNRFENRTAAMLWLLRAGLGVKVKGSPKKGVRKNG